MKILVLSYEYPPIGGGGGIICKYISENLAKSGNQVTILTTALPRSEIHNSTLNGVEGPQSAIRSPRSTVRNPKFLIPRSSAFLPSVKTLSSPILWKCYPGSGLPKGLFARTRDLWILIFAWPILCCPGEKWPGG